MRKRIAALTALVVVGGGALLLLERGPEAPVGTVEAPSSSQPVHSAAIAARPLPTLPATDEAPAALDLRELDARSATLTAKDRHAWLLSELIGGTSDLVPHAITRDGVDFPLASADRVLVVQRESGELYIGWLAEGADVNGPLADIERPAERIEGLARIALVPSPPVPAANAAAAKLTVVVDGQVATTIAPAGFSAAATMVVEGKHAAPAIEVERAFGRARIVGLEADGEHVEPRPPHAGARAVVFMNRRGRFKFAWLDRSGTLIGEQAREVSQIALRTRPAPHG